MVYIHTKKSILERLFRRLDMKDSYLTSYTYVPVLLAQIRSFLNSKPLSLWSFFVSDAARCVQIKENLPQ